MTEAIENVKLAKDAHWGVVISQRSGETEDAFIAGLCVGLAVSQIKAGAPCRGERLAKYNQVHTLPHNSQVFFGSINFYLMVPAKLKFWLIDIECFNS